MFKFALPATKSVLVGACLLLSFLPGVSQAQATLSVSLRDSEINVSMADKVPIPIWVTLTAVGGAFSWNDYISDYEATNYVPKVGDEIWNDNYDDSGIVNFSDIQYAIEPVLKLGAASAWYGKPLQFCTISCGNTDITDNSFYLAEGESIDLLYGVLKPFDFKNRLTPGSYLLNDFRPIVVGVSKISIIAESVNTQASFEKQYGQQLFLFESSPQNLTINVSAVPEPESLALLLAGLGLVTGVARLRQNQT